MMGNLYYELEVHCYVSDKFIEHSFNISIKMLQISVKYGGQDIPGSPFAMTSDPNLDDVGYEKNGTGLQKKKFSSSSARGNDDDKGNFITNLKNLLFICKRK